MDFFTISPVVIVVTAYIYLALRRSVESSFVQRKVMTFCTSIYRDVDGDGR